MPDKKENLSVSVSNAPVTEVNQYGDKSIHADHIDNVTVQTTVFNGQASPTNDEDGKPYVPLTPTRFSSKARTIFLGNETITLPIELTPADTVDSKELPCFNALCEAYAEKIKQIVTPDMIDSLPPGLRHNYSEQQRAFFSAENMYHSMREVFADGEEQFESLKADAFDGISHIYYDDSFATGYDRLIAVLNSIVNIPLSKSALTNIVGLIGNLEKKGICHILVNDEIIKSWVNIDA